MTEHHFPRAYARAVRWLCAALCLSALAASASAQTLPQGSPVLLTEGTGQTTRAVALTADAQDASGRVYPLKVEALTKPPYDIFDVVGKQHVTQSQNWLWAVTLRLDEQMTDTLGDVLVRINLHGLSSNRVRIAIGQTGGGIANDSATE